MDFQVVWTVFALTDLEAVIRHIADDNPAAAEAMRELLLESAAVLGRLPFIGPVYERDRTGRTREVVCRSYRIFYRVRESDQQVDILRIWHGARREPRLPKS
jgi:toxin ParE1/3/4